MLSNITKDYDFALLMKQHLIDVMGYLFDKGHNFGVLCKIDEVEFNPELPSYMIDSFPHLTLFVLAGYTYESAYIEEDNLIFEAGFGEENFGSVVTVPLLSIVQIVVDETPIFINLSESNALLNLPQKVEEIDEESVEKSMSVFLSNPENQKFFKK